MKTARNILVAFILNLAFSVFELIGGMLTGSISIMSDAVHDLGDAVSIGISYFLERKSRQAPDAKYTYGYARYSILGSLITTLVLLLGSAVMIARAVERIIHPAPIDYQGMMLFAVVGVGVNVCAALFTREGGSLNQKAVNLHMMEDAFGWIVVLVGAVVMRFTDFALIDPLLSIGVSLFILIHACRNMKEIMDLFLEKTPHDLDVSEIRAHIEEMDGVQDVHHIHLWSMDGRNHYATLHLVSDEEPAAMKEKIREELRKHGVGHVTIEMESGAEHCEERLCRPETENHAGHCSHHHSHHGHHAH